MSVKKILNQIKNNIKNECVSYGEIAYLQAHQKDVLETGDIELAEWAGIPEEEYNNYKQEDK